MKGNSPRCAYCGKPVIGDYTTALGKAWHPSHFICAQCRQPFDGGSFYERNGKAYCKRDFDELFGRRCASGELLGQNRYFEKDDKVYCETHYWQKFGKRCAIGGEILKGAYQVNAWGDNYCAAHARGLTDCFSCHRPICQPLTGGGTRYTDGREMCGLCRRTAIDELRVGEGILKEVRAFMTDLGPGLGRVITPLRLVDYNTMKRDATKPYAPAPVGMARHSSLTRNGQVTERTVEAIQILSGLPREHFAAVVAHELMHTYFFMNSFPDLPPLVVEAGWIERVRATMPELPADMRRRFVDDYDLGSYDATALTASPGWMPAAAPGITARTSRGNVSGAPQRCPSHATSNSAGPSPLPSVTPARYSPPLSSWSSKATGADTASKPETRSCRVQVCPPSEDQRCHQAGCAPLSCQTRCT